MADAEGAGARRSRDRRVGAVGFEEAEEVAGDAAFEAALDPGVPQLVGISTARRMRFPLQIGWLAVAKRQKPVGTRAGQIRPVGLQISASPVGTRDFGGSRQIASRPGVHKRHRPASPTARSAVDTRRTSAQCPKTPVFTGDLGFARA